MIRSFLDREGSTCFAEGLLGFDLVDGEVFVGLICPGSFYIRDFFVLVVVDVGLLCEYSCGLRCELALMPGVSKSRCASMFLGLDLVNILGESGLILLIAFFI